MSLFLMATPWISFRLQTTTKFFFLIRREIFVMMKNVVKEVEHVYSNRILEFSFYFSNDETFRFFF